VDVRQLALEELYRLVHEMPELVESILNLWLRLTPVQKEHVVLLLFSISIADASCVERWGARLIQLGQKENHYNLRATIAESIQVAVANGAQLNPTLVSAARALTSRPVVIVPRSPYIHAQAWNWVSFPAYLQWSLELLARAASPNIVDVGTRAHLAQLYPELESGLEDEAAVHRRYNINTNFDRIEIRGNYDGAVRESVNSALHELLQAHSIDEELLQQEADVLRISDPSDLVVTRLSRPSEIAWIDQTLSDEDFLAFADMEVIRQGFLLGDKHWITLYEHTEQRMGDRQGSDQTRATKIRLTVFGVGMGDPAPTLRETKEEFRRGVLMPFRNRYRFELARIESGTSHSLRRNGKRVVPLSRVSRCSFRGRHSTDIAAFPPELARELGLDRQAEGILGYNLGSDPVVRSVEWQEAFDQGRRRHEPKSSGFILQMAQEVISQLARVKGLDLWAYLVIQRTADKHKPEAEMNWQTHSEIFALQGL
jgi:hypothetical protein